MAFSQSLVYGSPPSSPLLLRSSSMEVETIYSPPISHFIWQEIVLNPPPNTLHCLSRHGITPHMRARMVDWIVDVMLKMDCMPNSIFVAVKVMDRFFMLSGRRQNQQDLMGVGMVAMFIASKYCDRYPIRMGALYKAVGFERIPVHSLLALEAIMLSTIGFSLSYGTALDALDILINETDLSDGIISQSSHLVLLISQLDPDLASIPPAKLATIALFLAYMTYLPRELPYLLQLTGFGNEDIAAECEKVYNFVMDLAGNGAYQAIFANLKCSVGVDERHPLFKFEDLELEREGSRLLEESRR